MSEMFDKVEKRMAYGGGCARLSPWMDDEHGAMRVILGSNPDEIRNRIAYIEKTPRVRINKTPGEPNAAGDWLYGPSGDGHECGKDQRSRDWCDCMLVLLGYQLVNDWAEVDWDKVNYRN